MQITKILQHLESKGYDPKEVVARWILEADEDDPDIEELKLAIIQFEMEDAE